MGAINWSTILYNLIFSIGGIGSVFWLAFRRAVHHVIQESGANKQNLATIVHEVTPNSGSSMNDRLKRVETQLDNIMTILMERGNG